MHSRMSCLLLLLLVAGSTAGAQQRAVPRGSSPTIERAIDSILALMTPEEKAGQLTQYSARWQQGKEEGALDPAQQERIRQGTVGSLLNLSGAEATRAVQHVAVLESRLRIPLLFGLDVIHGYRTILPIPLGAASTWEPALVELGARAAAKEASAAGIHWTFAPMVDIARDPRWGRIAEGSGEDPFLGSLMAAAWVRGFQGEHLSAESTILACPKHYAAYGGAEGGRDYNTVDISERTLREVYLPPFEAAVRAGAGTIMCSFNEIAGVPSTGNKRLLTDILRGEWGFPGFVVSDWGSIGELQAHGVAASLEEAALLALTAGTDMDMESSAYAKHLAALVRNGTVPVTVVDEAVRRVLRAKFRLGLFEDPYRSCSPVRESQEILSVSNLMLAREVAHRSLVLLRNDRATLPLTRTVSCIAVIGPLSDSRADLLGPWSALGRADDVVSILDGIKAAVPKKTTVLWSQGCAIDSAAAEEFSAAVGTARKADAVVLVLGESRGMSGEAGSRAHLSLPGNQEALARAVMSVGKPTAVIVLSGRPLAIPWLAAHAPALLAAWFPGVQGGHAVADVIFGDYNPSGKLPVSVPSDVGQVPIYYNHKNTGRPADAKEKYTSKYIDRPSDPLFPFGYGLSYTTFDISAPVPSSGEITRTQSVEVAVDVTNTGTREGEEVIQLYIRDDVASVTRPVKELRGFRKIRLAPGQADRVRFVLTPEHLAVYDSSFHRIVEPGTFTVFVGPNSRDVKSASFVVRP